MPNLTRSASRGQAGAPAGRKGVTMEKPPLIDAVASQALAALAMQRDCLERCPEEEWQEARGDYPFSRVLFHSLFDCDYSFSDSEESFRDQAFHRSRPEIFRDYEALLDIRSPLFFERDFIRSYHDFCVAKIEEARGRRSDAEMLAPDADIYGSMTRLERGLNAIRHVQHHAAQLGLRLQLASGVEMDWVSRGL